MSNQWLFVTAAYGVTALGTLIIIIHSWLKMRDNEARVVSLQVRPDDVE